MTPEELQKLLKLSAIDLPEDQKPAFLDYFNSLFENEEVKNALEELDLTNEEAA